MYNILPLKELIINAYIKYVRCTMIHVVCLSPSTILNVKSLAQYKYFSTVHTCNLKGQKTMLDDDFYNDILVPKPYTYHY